MWAGLLKFAGVKPGISMTLAALVVIGPILFGGWKSCSATKSQERLIKAEVKVSELERDLTECQDANTSLAADVAIQNDRVTMMEQAADRREQSLNKALDHLARDRERTDQRNTYIGQAYEQAYSDPTAAAWGATRIPESLRRVPIRPETN